MSFPTTATTATPPTRSLGADVARVALLEHALRTFGIRRDDLVYVLCCTSHAEDGMAVTGAALRIGAEVVSDDPDDGISLHAGRTPAVVLACVEGTQVWQASGRRGRLIGDAPGALWWRAWELASRYAL